MAGGKSPKCKYCTKEVDKSLEHIKKSNGYYHTDCYENFEAEKETRKKQKGTSKCAKCGNELVKKDATTKMIGTKFYHEECALIVEQEKREKKARPCAMCSQIVYIGDEGVQKDYKGYYHAECMDKKKRIAKNREELCLYIAKLYKIDYPTGFMLKQIDDFHKKRGYSYKSMLGTLMFIYEVENRQVKDGTGLGLIPFFYDKAKNYYSYLDKAKKSVGKNEKLVIQNNAERIKAVKTIKRKVGIIDMSNL